MATSLFQKLFASIAKPNLKAIRTKAEHGDAEAQFSLGLKYSSGHGDAHGFAEAVRWYRKAAEQNHSLAQFNLGTMFAQGQGVVKDDAAALTWIRKAAESGEAGAQHDLGIQSQRSSLRHSKMDATDSRIEAYKWLHLAAVQGYKGSAAACEQVMLGMSRAEVTEGNHRVAAFLDRKPQPAN
jgi:TPR repeat protein